MEKMVDIKTKKILVVDDSAANVELVKEILSRENLSIKAAYTAVDALFLLNRDTPDIILLDLMIPGMDGFEFMKIIKMNNDYKNIPVIVLSAISEPENIQKAFDLGINDYITKPFRMDELIKTIFKYV